MLGTEKETSPRSSYLPALLSIKSLCSNVWNSSSMIDVVATESLFLISSFIFSNHIILVMVAVDLQPIQGAQSPRKEHYVYPVNVHRVSTLHRVTRVQEFGVVKSLLTALPCFTSNTKSKHVRILFKVFIKILPLNNRTALLDTVCCILILLS